MLKLMVCFVLVVLVGIAYASCSVDTIMKVLGRQKFDTRRNFILCSMIDDIDAMDSIEMSNILNIYTSDNGKEDALSKMKRFTSMYEVSDIENILNTFSSDDYKFSALKIITQNNHYKNHTPLSYEEVAYIVDIFDSVDSHNTRVVDFLIGQCVASNVGEVDECS